jgi:hypothetical protein
MDQFFRTLMGRKFFDSQLPSLIKGLSGVGELTKELRKSNQLKEIELGLREKEDYETEL